MAEQDIPTVNLAEVFQIDPAKEPVSNLVKLYEEQVAIIDNYNKAFREGRATDEVTKSALERFEKSDGTLASLFADFADRVFTYVQNNPQSVLAAMDELDNIVAPMKAEKNYRVDAAVRSVKREKGITGSTASEEAMDALANHLSLLRVIDIRIKNARNMAEITGELDPEVANLIKSGKGENGKTRIDISNKRSLESGETARKNVGRNAKLSRVQFTWLPVGSDEPVSLSPNLTVQDIAHCIISQGRYRVTGADLDKRIKDAGDSFYTKEGGNLEFETGVLYGVLVD